MRTFKAPDKKVTDYVFIGLLEKLFNVKASKHVKELGEFLSELDLVVSDRRYDLRFLAMPSDLVVIREASKVISSILFGKADNNLLQYLYNDPYNVFLVKDEALKEGLSLWVCRAIDSTSNLTNENTILHNWLTGNTNQTMRDQITIQRNQANGDKVRLLAAPLRSFIE